MSVEQIIELVCENATAVDNDRPACDSLFRFQFEEIISIRHSAARKTCNEVVRGREHDDIRKILSVRLSPLERLVEPTRRNSIEEVGKEYEALASTEREVEVVVDDAPVEECCSELWH